MAAQAAAGPPPARSSPTGTRSGSPIPPACWRGRAWWTRRRTTSSWPDVVGILKDYDFLVLFTSTMGWEGDQKMAEVIKQTYPKIKIAFVGPPVTTSTDRALNECPAIDFVCRREFDFSVVEYANGKPLERDPRRQLQGRQWRHPAQSRPPAGHPGAARRDALGHRDLRARPRRHQVQRALPAASVRLALLAPAAARRNAPSACGRRRSAATHGASGLPTMWRPRWPTPRSSSPTSRSSSSTTTPSIFKRPAPSSCARS